jgi:hypothetical protein
MAWDGSLYGWKARKFAIWTKVPGPQVVDNLREHELLGRIVGGIFLRSSRFEAFFSKMRWKDNSGALDI